MKRFAENQMIMIAAVKALALISESKGKIVNRFERVLIDDGDRNTKSLAGISKEIKQENRFSVFKRIVEHCVEHIARDSKNVDW